ncbi:MAG TPA: gamma-glutamyltransferase [Rickettsiales bacterium]|nr:gamma-glutamyltransferase [Rickettsiales bacterium]
MRSDLSLRRFLWTAVVALLSVPAVATAQEGILAAPPAHYDYDRDTFHPVYAQHGMVATEQALASQVGADILKQGGNAVDAAVGVGFALAVVLPNAGNIGGGGFMLVHDEKTGKDIALDFREVAPGKATETMFQDENGNVIKDASLYTHNAVGVPGTVAGMQYALEHWGTMKLADVIAPSISLAEKGFPVSYGLAHMLELEKAHLAPWESTRKIFFRDGHPLREGDMLVQKDLGHSLSLIATQGPKAFYNGEIADRIVAEMKQHGGIMTRKDFEDYKVAVREPVSGEYRGFKVVSMPPPSSGGVHIIEILNMLEHYPLSQYGFGSAKAIHYMAEAMKLAYADRSKYLGDPDFTKVPVKGLTSKHYADELVQRIDPVKPLPAEAFKPGNPLPYESSQTTHYSIVDGKGNAVAVTYTLNFDFGSGIVAEGTGIMLNDEMDDFSSKPGVPNGYGVTGGKANAIEPRKRPLSSMSPTFVLKNGKIWLVTGSPGGSRIITTTLQTILNMIDFGMNPAEAATAPRVHDQWLPDTLRIEKGLSPDTLKILQDEGYHVSPEPTMGRVQIIQVRDDGVYGYSDSRNPDGAAIGY